MEVAAPYDWSRFDVHMLFPVDPETLYRAWATSSGMESFFAKRFTFTAANGKQRAPEESSAVGDAYALDFHHPFSLTGIVTRAEPHAAFAFSFGQMHVRVTIHPADAMTRLHLCQTDIPTSDNGRIEDHLNCRSCWCYYLLNLRSVLAHGHDLRDEGLPDNPVSVHFTP